MEGLEYIVLPLPPAFLGSGPLSKFKASRISLPPSTTFNVPWDYIEPTSQYRTAFLPLPKCCSLGMHCAPFSVCHVSAQMPPPQRGLTWPHFSPRFPPSCCLQHAETLNLPCKVLRYPAYCRLPRENTSSSGEETFVCFGHCYILRPLAVPAHTRCAGCVCCLN